MISIFTPTNDSKFLPEVYKSLLAQTNPDWEWIILYNNGAEPITFDDPRVKTFYAYGALPYVGFLKAAACEKATGDILLELDHDDLLLPTAVEEVKKAFQDSEIGFVYSNPLEANGDFSKRPRFSEDCGWKYREVEFQGHALDELVMFEPSPESISRVWFAPDHLRAFRKSVYEEVGGYNREMRVLDDADLMCRMYSKTKFKHIDKPLYLYRVTGENAWLKHNEEIQDNVYRLYDKYIESLVERSCELRGLAKIEVGGRMAAKPGYTTVDIRGNPDVVCDLEVDWPFADSSVGIIRAFDVFEHLKDPIHTMKEAARVLAPGGWLMCQVPSTDGRGAFQDPTHRSFWNDNSFLYYTNRNWARYIDTPVRFQAPRLYTTEKNQNSVCWTIAHLLNLKGGYQPPGLIEI